MRQIDVERTGEIDYKTFAQWFGTTKQAEKAERAEAARVRSEMVIDRWASLYEQVRTNPSRSLYTRSLYT